MIETSQISVLMAVDQATSLSQAAEFLNITQSAVSQNLKNLESKVGFPVVTRQGKKVVLTPGGKKLAKLGKTYSKRFDDLIDELQQEKQRILGSISIGTMYGIGKSWIAQRMIEFSTHFPELEVKVTMDFPDKLISGFENREFDCLVLPETLVPAHCESKVLHNEKSTLVFPDSPKFNITTKTELKELTEFPLIFFEDRDPLFFQWCREKFGSVPRNIRPRIVVNAFGQILQAVHEGQGIAVVPTHVFRRSYFKDKVKTLGKKFDIQSNTFQYAFHSEDKESLKINTLYDFLHKEVENLDI
jgi:DNA-binding transcriptional LysR family regulator